MLKKRPERYCIRLYIYMTIYSYTKHILRCLPLKIHHVTYVSLWALYYFLETNLSSTSISVFIYIYLHEYIICILRKYLYYINTYILHIHTHTHIIDIHILLLYIFYANFCFVCIHLRIRQTQQLLVFSRFIYVCLYLIHGANVTRMYNIQ